MPLGTVEDRLHAQGHDFPRRPAVWARCAAPCRRPHSVTGATWKDWSFHTQHPLAYSEIGRTMSASMTTADMRMSSVATT